MNRCFLKPLKFSTEVKKKWLGIDVKRSFFALFDFQPLLSLLTPRRQARADGCIATGLLKAGIGIEDTAQLQIRQSHHFCIARPFVLQRQLVVVQRDRV